jgi:hypothetical protein
MISRSPPVTTASLFETRPQRSGGGRLPATCHTPDSPTCCLPNNNPYHARNGSSSSSYSPAGSLFHLQNVGQGGPVVQNTTELNNSVRNHRRTASFPSQAHSGPTGEFHNHNQSQPIPIPSEGCLLTKSPPGNGNTTPLGNYSSHPNPNNSSTMMKSACGSGSGSCSNLEQLNLNGSTSTHRPESRVGSPLEKISETEWDPVPPIWCLDCQENIVVLGTGKGRIELWDAFSGYLKVSRS